MCPSSRVCFMCACACSRPQGIISGIVHLLILIRIEIPYHNCLELTKQARLVSQSAPGICLSHLPSPGITSACHPPRFLFLFNLGSGSHACKHFISQTISSALNPLLLAFQFLNLHYITLCIATMPTYTSSLLF